MTTGDYPPPDPNFPQPGGYPPPPPGGYPPPPPGYGPPQGYPVPQYGQSGGYPPPVPTGRGTPGTLGARFAARFIDAVLVGVLATVLAWLVDADTDAYLGIPYGELFTRVGFFSGGLTFLYFVAFEVWQGWTPGKKILGMHVLGAGGAAKPDLKQSAIRNSFTLLALVPCLGFLLAPIAYIVIAVTINSSPTKQGKHDELAGGTQVVKH